MRPTSHPLRQALEHNATRWLVMGLAAAAALWVEGSGQAGGGGDSLVMLGVGTAALISGIAGFAFSAIAGAVLFHVADDPVRLVQIMLTCSIANQAAMTWAGRHDIDWRHLAVFVAGGIPGIAVGLWILLHADHHTYMAALGLWLVAYATYMLLRRPITLQLQHPLLDATAGFIGGVTGGAAAFPSVPVAIWCSLKGWHKDRQRVLFQPYILILQLITLLGLSLVRPHAPAQWGFDWANLLFVPASLLGTMGGIALFKHISDRQFGRAVNLMLLASGLSYVV